MTQEFGIVNEEQLYRLFVGTEAQLGLSVAPTYKLYGKTVVNKTRPLADREEYAGTWFADYAPVWGAVAIDGTYEQPLTYEDGPILLRYAVKGAPTGVSDAQAVPGYLYTLKHTAAKRDLDYFSAELGIPGMPWEITGGHFPEFTISADIDDAEAAWKYSAKLLALGKEMKAATTGTATGGSPTTVVKTGAGWTVDAFAGAFVKMLTGTAGNIGKILEVLSNTATTLTLAGAFPSAVANLDTFEITGTFTTGIGDRTREVIDAPGTQVFIDDTLALGTTERAGILSFSVTGAINSYGKRFLKDTAGYSKYGRGKVRANGQVRMEFDSRKEYDEWTAKTAVHLRFFQQGSIIDSGAATHKSAQIDVPNAQWENLTPDTRERNLTATFGFRGFVDTTGIGTPAQWLFKNKLATLP